MSTTLLPEAIRRALRNYGVTGVSVALGCAAAPAFGQQAASAPDQKSQSLETIVVTGSNIRRVDIETANPVVTIDKAQIQQSGKLTLGDLVQNLPAMAGSPMSPSSNNGGGTGASVISLRGLGVTRSLLLINGHRVATPLQDLNMMPLSAVERVEVLSDGSSAVYGSDAVGGVVNVITRANYQGAEFGADYGITDHDDGARKGYHLMLGQTTDKGSIVLGLNYNKNDAVSAANRAYSHDALYKYNTGYVLHAGSSRTPNGSISLPASLAAQFGHCSGNRVTRIDGRTGTSLADYRCYNPAKDAFNYQAVGNYDQTRNERSGVFALGNYKLSDNVEAFIEVFHNKTTSNAQIAPLPLDALTDTFISKNNYYNPFGIDFGTPPGGSATNQFRTRLQTLGNRIADFSTDHDLVTTGFKGNVADSSWSWTADFSYGHLSQELHQKGYLNYTSLAQPFGPSFKDPTTGQILCGTPGNAISGCTPVNIFNINDPTTIAVLRQNASNPFTHLMYQTRTAEAGVTGSLFDLPAGAVQLAAGASYRKEWLHQEVDSTIEGFVNSKGVLSCTLSFSICSGSTRGGFNVKEAYAELLVPIVKDVPFAHSLNLDIGDRYSKYSNFGSTNNWKLAVEYRPLEDLLLRATVSKVFRAPSATDIFAGPAGDSPTAADPCGTSTNPACQGYTFVSTGTSQLNGVVVGSHYAAQKLGFNAAPRPEFGKSYDYGFVYDPAWVPGLSISGDMYRITLNNLIVSGPGNAQLILTQCFNSQGTSPLCSLIARYSTGSNKGQILSVYESTFNLGDLSTKGADIGASYRLPETRFGNFRVGLQTTYIGQYTIDSGGVLQGYAGHFDKAIGNIARWRALANIDWNWGPFTANWTMRHVGKVKIGYANADLGPSASADGLYTPDGASVYHYPSYTYHNVSLGYTIEPINTTLIVGIDNLADKQPPIFFQQNVLNANTDVSTYDSIGRFYFAKVLVKF